MYLLICPTNNSCRETAVCIGDQLLDFSVPKLVRNQSKFSIYPEVPSGNTNYRVPRFRIVLSNFVRMLDCMLATYQHILPHEIFNLEV